MTVVLAYLHPNTVSHSFSDSLMRLVAWDLSHHGNVISSGGPVQFRCGPGGLVEARNDVVAHFLTTGHEWLFMVDADMGFAPNTVDRLLEAADPVERPVVGGLCFGMREVAADGMSGWATDPFPTLYDFAEKQDGTFGFTIRREYRVNSLTRVAGTGAACLLVHRSVFERIGGQWFDRVTYADGKRVAEDLSFCYRAAQQGIPIHVHTGVRTTHHKQVWLGEGDYWRRAVPPADEPVAVLVPVMRRPQNAEPLMRSLRASTGLADVYAIADVDDADTIKAWEAADASVVVLSGKSPGTFAQKINHAFGQSHICHPWVFVVGDDVRFHPGWLDHAQHVAKTMNADVVGTNDLGNPRVMDGEHATHLLIRRDYIEEQGASWDGPGVVCHEGYRHWYVDDEIVTAAKQRGRWAMALGSVVEHLHPAWGKAEADQVYELGQAHAKQDRTTFEARCRTHLS